MRYLFASVTMLCAIYLVGCDKPATKTEYVLVESVTLKQDGATETKITRSGKDLKDADLAFTSSDPGVTVEAVKFKGDAKEALLKVKAAKDAAVKDHTVTVKIGDVTKLLKVKVEAVTPAVIEKKAGEEEKKK